MANSFKLHTFSGSSTNADTAMTVYTSPASTTAIILGLTISNTTASTLVFIDVKINNIDGDEVFLVRGAPVPQGSSIEIMAGNKLTLEASDSIKVYSNAANSVDTIVSVMEQS